MNSKNSMNAVLRHNVTDRVRLPSGRLATVERWRIEAAAGREERVCSLRMVDGTTITVSEAYMALARNLSRG